MSDFQIREASADDVPDLIRLVRRLATYEKEPESATATPEQFREALFPAHGDPTAYALVGVREGSVVAMAIWFRSLLDVDRPGRHLAGGPLRRPRAARARPRQGPARPARRDLRRARLDPARVVGARLEHPVHRLLPRPRRPVPRRLDDLPPRRRRALATGGPVGGTPAAADGVGRRPLAQHGPPDQPHGHRLGRPARVGARLGPSARRGPRADHRALPRLQPACEAAPGAVRAPLGGRPGLRPGAARDAGDALRRADPG